MGKELSTMLDHVAFTRRGKGYDRAEVDAFIAELRATAEQPDPGSAAAAEPAVKKFEEVEGHLGELLGAARRSADELLSDAREIATSRVAKAEARAGKLLARAEDHSRKQMAEADRYVRHVKGEADERLSAIRTKTERHCRGRVAEADEYAARVARMPSARQLRSSSGPSGVHQR